jgi:hypothetical protein
MTASSSKKPTNLVSVLWAVLNGCPHEYGAALPQALSTLRVDATRALAFPVSRTMEHKICNMPNHVSSAPQFSRGQRLRMWSEVCVQRGADPRLAVESLGEHAAAGFGRLFKMKAFECVLWWREQGVEPVLKGPVLLNKEPTTLATLAFIEGSLKGIEVLLPGSHLTHLDKMWHQVWTREGLPNMEELIGILMPLSPPPPDCFAAMAKAPVSQSNVAKVLRATQCLVDHKITPNAYPSNRPAPLSILLRHMISPATVQVMDYLLEQGADPVAPVREGKHEETIVEFAMSQWIHCTPRSHLREPRMQCVKRLIMASPQEALDAIFTPAYQARIAQEIRETENSNPSFSIAGKVNNWTPGKDLAEFQSWWLNRAASDTATTGSPRPRF